MAKKEWHSLRALSRVDYGEKVDSDNLVGPDILKKGALLRIADALERLATGKTELETLKELEGQKKIVSDLSNSYITKEREAGSLCRSISAYKGVIAKLKGKLAVK